MLEDEERTIIEINAERGESISHELHQLSLEEQRTHDLELSQLHDDVLHHENATVNHIIVSFERHHSSSDEIDDLGNTNDGSGSGSVNVFNRVWWDEPPALLQANMQLLTFLTQQSETIARLRVRIVKLKGLIYDLSYRSSNTPQDHVPSPTPTPGTHAPPPGDADPSPSTVKTYYGV